jgi:hypothetical protein
MILTSNLMTSLLSPFSPHAGRHQGPALAFGKSAVTLLVLPRWCGEETHSFKEIGIRRRFLVRLRLY